MFKATFEVPALLRIQVSVHDAQTQTEALVQALDALQAMSLADLKEALQAGDAWLGQAQAELATNIDLCRQNPDTTVQMPQEEASRATAPSATSAQLTEQVNQTRNEEYRVHLFFGKLPDVAHPADCVKSFQTLPQAKAFLEANVLYTLSTYASGRVINTLTGSLMANATHPRGAWEVLASDSHGKPIIRHSWLPDAAQTRALMRDLLQREDVAFVESYDITDRERGPVLLRRVS